MRLTPRKITAVVGAILVVGAVISSVTVGFVRETDVYGGSDGSQSANRRRALEDAFQFAWDGYSTYCMGHDSLHPVTNTCDDDFGGWGVTAIDALSTALMFGNEKVAKQIVEFIATIDWTVVKGGTSVQLFEVTIRHFGGMIAAIDLLDGPASTKVTDESLRKALHDQAVRLGDALSCAFITPSGVPRNWVNPTLCITDDGTSNTLAGAGSLILEFGRLSDITGNMTYRNLAERAEQYLLNPQPEATEPWPGLLGSFVSVDTGTFVNTQGSWGSLSDSFYEYLLKAYIYNSSRYGAYVDRWRLAADSTIRYLASSAYGHSEWTFLPFWQDEFTSNAMDALSWFAGGNFILGGMVMDNQTWVDFGLRIADTAGAMYQMTTTGLGGEFVAWTNTCGHEWGEQPCSLNNSVAVTDASYLLRPEVFETWYYAYRATNDTKYQDWAWAAFNSIDNICKTNSGYSSIYDVNDPGGGYLLDKQDSFVYAEVFKYIWLIHQDDEIIPQVQDSRTGVKNTWVFNTEAHPFKVAGPPV